MQAKFFIEIGIFWSFAFRRDINVLFHWLLYVSTIPKVIISMRDMQKKNYCKKKHYIKNNLKKTLTYLTTSSHQNYMLSMDSCNALATTDQFVNLKLFFIFLFSLSHSSSYLLSFVGDSIRY